MQRLSILFPAPLGCYDYLSPTPIPPGTFVRAPFGRKQSLGVVWDASPDLTFSEDKLKQITEVLSIPPLPQETIDFVGWVAKYTLSPLGMVLKMALNPEIEKISKKPTTFLPPNPTHQTLDFSSGQQSAIAALTALNGFQVALLDGVTGSGKTEVYFESIATALTNQKQVLVLLPEITLTAAWLTRFEKRFGTTPALWHSAITPKQRRDTWNAVLDGSVQVIVGARSALFLPFQRLGLIIIDEEHDASFKQEDGVLYHARDMAIVRAKMAECPIVLASATPSLETYCNAESGRYHHIHLPERFANAALPDIEIVDMRFKDKNPSDNGVRFISPTLQRAVAETLTRKEQSLLFINRRGYAPLVLCRACGERLKCPHCSAWLVEHKKQNNLQCHHCGHTKRKPTACPSCTEKDAMISCGPGVERILEETQTLFPDARAEIITSDTLNNPAAFQTLLDKMENHELDILIGTQILAKGHHFADLTLVGVIDADMGLAGGDLRASERTFQLLHQVMGRAGRESKKGRAILQSFSPENMIIQALKKNDRSTFMGEEIRARQLLKMPPFGKLAALIISGKNQEQVYQVARKFAQHAPYMEGVDVLGPAPAPIAVLRGKHRFRLLIKTPKEFKMQNMLSIWMRMVTVPKTVDVRLDIDPYSFF